jgi:hypothetical protein
MVCCQLDGAATQIYCVNDDNLNDAMVQCHIWLCTSVKNKSPVIENIGSPFISTENVEDTTPPKSRNKANHYLGLKRLESFYAEDSSWAPPSEKQPTVGMVLSMADTTRTDNIVVIEKRAV